MSTHTKLDPTEANVERALQRQVDEMGDFHRSFAPVLRAAHQREKRVKTTRAVTALGSVAALLVTGVAVTRLDRQGNSPSTVVADEAPVELRLIPGWVPGGPKTLRRTIEREAVSEEGYEAGWYWKGAIISASTVPTGELPKVADGEPSTGSRLVGPSIEPFPFARDCQVESKESWTLEVCAYGPTSIGLDAFANALSVGNDGKIIEGTLPVGATRRFVEKWSEIKPIAKWEIASDSISISAQRESALGRKVREDENRRLGRPRSDMGDGPFSEQRVSIRGNEGIELVSSDPPRDGVLAMGTVEWFEGGWFLKVSGMVSDLSTLRRVAQSLRPATEKEWASLDSGPNTPQRAVVEDLVPSVEIASGEIGDVGWTATIAEAATEQGCVNLTISAANATPIDRCVVLTDQAVLSATAHELGGRRVVIAVVSDAVDLIRVGGPSASTGPVGVDGIVISDGSKWRWVGVAVVPVEQEGELSVEAFSEEVVTSDDPDDTTPNPLTSVGTFPVQ